VSVWALLLDLNKLDWIGLDWIGYMPLFLLFHVSQTADCLPLHVTSISIMF